MPDDAKSFLGHERRRCALLCPDDFLRVCRIGAPRADLCGPISQAKRSKSLASCRTWCPTRHRSGGPGASVAAALAPRPPLPMSKLADQDRTLRHRDEIEIGLDLAGALMPGVGYAEKLRLQLPTGR